MITLTLAEQMQAIMERVGAPAIVDADFVIVTPAHHCHCGAPLYNTADGECPDCTAEWQEYITEPQEVWETLRY